MAETSECLLSEDDGNDGEYIPHRVVDFNAKYLKPQKSEKFKDVVKTKASKCFTTRNLKNCFLSNIPIIGNMRKYKIRQYLLSDILSGITVGIMQIPQGMAFGLLTTLPPICGLYTALFGPLTYFFLGTSRHLSIGAVAVVSLMLSSVIDVGMQENNFYDVSLPANQSNTSTQSVDDIINQRKIEIATSVSLVSGLLMILLGKLRFGLISAYMSEQFVSGFSAAVATHILTSQAKHVFGISVPRHNGIFKLVKTWIDVFRNIPSTNPAALITTVVCLIILYLVKVQVNMRFKAKLKMPIPIELIMIAITTVISHFAEFNDRFDVTILKDIPPGLPAPTLPNPVLATNHIADAFIIGIVAFAQSVSGARLLLARKHNYKINPNQELVAYGGGSVVCSIFSGYINAGSLSRTMVLDGTNGKSQIASLVGCVIVVIMIVAVGPLVYSLPKCVLSAIIIINLRTMFLQFLEIPSLWRTSKYDFVIWIVTFLTSTILDADIGFAVSLVFSILTVSVRTQRPLIGSLGYVGSTEHMKITEKYDRVVEPEGVKIVQFQAPIYFANADIFVKSVLKGTGVDPFLVKKRRKKYNQNSENVTEIKIQEKSAVNGEIDLAENDKMTDSFTDGLKVIILDLSGVNFVDVVGVKTIKRVYSDYSSIDVPVYLTHCNDNVVSMLSSRGFLKDHGDFVYLTTNCVLSHCQKNSV